ncbi:neutral ceramidase isoform X2 [Rhodnius prolixus]
MAWYLLLFLAILTVQCYGAYRIGVGIADITGPPAEVAFMGYAKPDQKGQGIHTRQFARSYIVDDGKSRIVFVTTDCGMMGTFLRKEVLKRLKQTFGPIYNENNVMISGTHTHSTPGGYLMDIIFDLNTFGFVRETFEAYAEGISRSVRRAHDELSEGKIFVTTGEILNANINRSPTAYLQNPPEERAKYKYDVDKMFTQLKFYRKDGKPVGMLTWYAIHGTSMNNTNKLVSSDNVGLASILFEQRMNSNFTKLIGKGPFIAAFASSNLGDVSPNIRGPLCHMSGQPCDPYTSTCKDKKDKCIAFGPGRDMFESTAIIASRLLEGAWRAWTSKGVELNGPLRVVHQYVDMPSQKVPYRNPKTGRTEIVKGCVPAMGYSFAAGTTDGPGAFSFQQGTVSDNPLWNALTNILATPTKEQIACQAPKPILLSTGEMNFPFEWQPSVVSTQLVQLGFIAIACVPGEFTTMSGRRLREKVASCLGLDHPERVIIAGLCNTYSDYITTPEEYQVQRYEGASTIFGPHTLTIYLNQFSKLAEHIKKNTTPSPGPEVPESFSDLISLLPPVIFDTAGIGYDYGDVMEQPKSIVKIGETVSATFVSGHPRNGIHQEGSYLVIEKQDGNNGWRVVATDANWETKFHWIRRSSILGTSKVEISWTVPFGTEPGVYRIRHFGHHKYIYGTIEPYEGVSASFKVPWPSQRTKEKAKPKVQIMERALLRDL